MMLGPIPSGEANIVSLRHRIHDLRFGPGQLAEFVAGFAVVTPAVVHATDEYIPDATTVFVWWGMVLQPYHLGPARAC